MKTIRFALVTVGAIALVFAYATARTTASAATTGCDSFKGQLTETTVPSPSDPLGRVIGALSNGRVKGPMTSRFTAITPTADGGLQVATDEVYVPSAGQNLTGTGVMRLTPDPSSSGAYLAEETLTITGGTGSLAGATGTISLTGTAVGLLSPPGVLDLAYRGSICIA